MSNFKTGKVIQTVNQKTITVLVINYKNHPLYRKRYIASKKYLVHDPDNKAKLEDMVSIKQSRPISKRKTWVLDKIINQSDSKINPQSKANTDKVTKASEKSELKSTKPKTQISKPKTTPKKEAAK
ncbi:MAG: 30S ribosomal protein S17 [Candidatus Saccharibacteria bacterium]|nr:30S ribosomal protein S17 [Candidatus Saccharibacteria bacterium]MCY4010956.1 30S ribosomal protein S17 [Candidatus Saccharibacteria bacterium]MCY4089053.1 30S ribosomal protein S17 [Candidatus Saccharibacteria bacterium]